MMEKNLQAISVLLDVVLWFVVLMALVILINTNFKRNPKQNNEKKARSNQEWVGKESLKQQAKNEVTRFKRPLHWDIHTQSQNPGISGENDQIDESKWTKAFLTSMEWKVFEDVCVEYLKLRKCKADVTSLGKDGGIDLKVKNEAGDAFIIGQVKAWVRPVGVDKVRELYGIMAAEKVNDGFFITTSTFTVDAWAFQKGKRIILIDGDECIKRVNKMEKKARENLNLIAKAAGYEIPTCVSCGIKMIQRESKKGKTPGKKFWGCKNYPKCKNTMFVKN